MNQEKTLLCRNNDRDALSWILIGHDQDQLCCKQLGETAHEAIAPARLTLYLESVIKHAVGYIIACFDTAGMKCFLPTNENPVDSLQTSMYSDVSKATSNPGGQL